MVGQISTGQKCPCYNGDGKVSHRHWFLNIDYLTVINLNYSILYLNSSPVYWLSKKQQSIETSSFGAEFTAMKQCTEYIRGLRYKLRMMSIPCSGPAYIYGDNQSVLVNSSMPDSVLKKKSNSIAYNFVREGVAMREWILSYVNTKEKLADFLTKALIAEQRAKLIRRVLYHLWDS